MAGQVERDDPDRGDHGVQRASAPDQRLRADGQAARHRPAYGEDADGGEGRDDQEHRAPAEQVDQRAGDERAGDRRHHPGRGEQREDARAQVRRVRRRPPRRTSPSARLRRPDPAAADRRRGPPSSRRTRRRGDRPRSRCRPRVTGRLAPRASLQMPPMTIPTIAAVSMPDDRDRVERLAAELPRHARHRQADRDRLEREHGDQRQQPDRDGAVLLVEGTRRSVGPGHGHGRQSTTSSMVEVKWITPSC